ncbi:head-tail connector protein [Asticcacaulis sp.]|uniref:head-tail connector protein n=1 Tax=Asticcacaulis sp. TaxID=1872648 RepID=UPI003F7C5B2B
MLNVVVIETGPLFTLDEAKAHLKVDFSDDDAIIETYSNSSVALCLQYCNRDLVPYSDIAVAAFKAAALMTLTDFYEGHQPVISSDSPAGRMLNPYRWLRV